MLSALDLARRIDAGQLTPAAVVDLCAEAISAREADIRAFIALDLEGARRRAKEQHTQLARSPLRGLPVGIKDIFDTATLPTEYGSPIYAGHRPRADAALVSLLLRAGGLALGKTATTEFAYLQPTKTRNPHDLRHTPGGSSSGSAAAVAAGMLPVALGSQTGGSIIRPAAYCGVAGFKPSYRLLPTVGMKCFSWHLDTAGLFAASVADVAFAAAAISGRDLRVDDAPPAAPRIALVRTHKWDEASADMRGAVATAARAAEAAGARVKELTLPPLFEEAFDAHATIQGYEAWQALAFEYDHHGERLSPILRDLLDAASTIRADAYDTARRLTRRTRRLLADLMADIDVLLTPSAPGAAPASLDTTGTSIFNRLWTLVGTPCVNVPGLTDGAGLPLGIQVVGRFGRDRSVLEAARFVAEALTRMSGRAI
ncbi:MAG TPA: amidase [Xanthobacteraceae bacterium]|jgi:Asp-tRNA(Asn)/Glu-tRNA(Gln) amidotransferase A subunit family amidase|nr:amidase [Xanthobacteraceae bacterium]